MSASTAIAEREWQAPTSPDRRGRELAANRLAAEKLLNPPRIDETRTSGEAVTETSPLPITQPGWTPVSLRAEWNGCVLDVHDHFFTAELTGIIGEGVSGEEEDAEIPISDVAPSDRELLTPGNFFRLCVFYETQEDGRPRRYTQVVFRRLPAYRASDLAKAAERSSQRHRALRVE